MIKYLYARRRFMTPGSRVKADCSALQAKGVIRRVNMHGE